MFVELAKSINAKNVVFHGQSSRLNIDPSLFTQLAARDEKSKNWVKSSFEDYQSKHGNEDKRFSITNTATDHMSWELNNVKADFFEAVIEFDGEIKRVNHKGKVRYISEYHHEKNRSQIARANFGHYAEWFTPDILSTNFMWEKI